MQNFDFQNLNLRKNFFTRAKKARRVPIEKSTDINRHHVDVAIASLFAFEKKLMAKSNIRMLVILFSCWVCLLTGLCLVPDENRFALNQFKKRFSTIRAVPAREVCVSKAA